MGRATGGTNTAVGAHALLSLGTGYDNTALGAEVIFNNSHGEGNTVIGAFALYFTEGSHNTTMGDGAMGNSNVLSQASYITTIGDYNTAIGQSAMFNDSTGHNNTALGQKALLHLTSGSNNVAIGSSAGVNLTTGDNNIDVFARGFSGDANTIRIGKQGTQTQSFVAGIFGTTVSDGVAVVVDKNGRLGTTTSSRRFKTQIEPMSHTSDAILSLKPVTFRYKDEADSIPQFGLIAEQVDQVNPDLVVRDDGGKPYTVRYDAVNAMLLNEFIKQHQQMDEQRATIDTLRSAVAVQQEKIDALTKAFAHRAPTTKGE